MTKDEALRDALMTLESCEMSNCGRDWIWPESGLITAMKNVRASIASIKEALAEPDKEPVAWMVYTQEGQSAFVTDNPAEIHPSQRALPLYATPQWVGLTDEELMQCLDQAYGINMRFDGFARIIEAKLKEKNS